MRKRKENNELLNNFSTINKKAGLRAGLETIIILILGIIGAIILWAEGIGRSVIIIYSLLILLMCIIYFDRAKKLQQEQEIILLKIALLDKCISFQEYTEVKPLNMVKFKKEMLSLANSYTKILPLQNVEKREYKKDITELLENAKFYAHISKNAINSIEIFVKYEKEGKFRYYKSVTKEDFLDEYAIQEEIE